MYKIAKKLNNEGISPKRSTKLTSQGIKNVLLNQVYKGIKIYDDKIEKMEFCKRKYSLELLVPSFGTR
ncbi:recombinase family protein [Bacillus cereus]|nr:recombinase family protein [Bacillus cereus]MDA2127194.1 recombinase family protein [Bacillus cereus]MDA2149920.1 recombinase family protein [Bacillus cereus]MEB9164008.1 recombinase family protein [Bacillus cereus]